MQNLTIDPEFEAAIDPLSAEEKATLEKNIVTDGCRDPLVTWSGLLLDGHHRYAICTTHNIHFDTIEIDLPDREAALDWIDANQLGRRNLTPDAFRLLLGRRYNRMKKAAHRPKEELRQNDGVKGETAGTLASQYGVSPRTVERAGKFAEEVESDPELLQAVKEKRPVSRAKRVKRDRVAEQRRVKQAKEDAEKKGEKIIVDIRHGDFREVLKDLKDIDAIITDPPYGKKYLPLLADLSAFADRILKPDGILAVLMGQAHLPEVYRLLSGGRPYRWTMCYQTPAAGYVAHQAKVQTNWKPVIIYGGGSRFADVIKSDSGIAGQSYHKWGQDFEAFRQLVERLTTSGDMIVDPFAGGGTTLLAAHSLGRHCTGCDIDIESIETAKGRLL